MTELDAAEKAADGDTVRDTVVSPTSTSSPDAPRWRCVASSADLRAVASARVRFTCVDATPALVVLGANTGSAYIFSRTRGPTDARGSSRSAPERRLRFVAVVSPELLGRGTGDRARAAPQRSAKQSMWENMPRAPRGTTDEPKPRWGSMARNSSGTAQKLLKTSRVCQGVCAL